MAVVVCAASVGCSQWNPEFRTSQDDVADGTDTAESSDAPETDADADKGDDESTSDDGTSTEDESSGESTSTSDDSTSESTGGPDCPQGQTDCGGICVDTLEDPENCGQCGLACFGDEVCLAGSCERLRLAFVSNIAVMGNFGGVEQADNICQSTAMEANLLPGNYKAWVSDGETSPAETFTHDGVFVRPDWYVIAYDWEQLTGGELYSAINLDAFGNPTIMYGSCDDQSPAVWTGVLADGTPDAFNCGGWSTAEALGTAGSVDALTGWSDACEIECAATLPVYCFRQ